MLIYLCLLLTAQLRAQQEQGASGQNVNVPIPMDQLRGMANEMNSILSNLLVSDARLAEKLKKH